MASSSRQPELLLVKLGGSVLTDKRRPRSLRRGVLARLAAEIAAGYRERGGGLVLGHGSGSFGHAAASRHDLAGGVRSAAERRGVAEIQLEARRLHERVTSALFDAGALPYSLAPSSFLTARRRRPVTLTLRPLLDALDLGLLPVTYGDVVMDRELGASVCSTEAVLRCLALRLRGAGWRIGRMLWVGETEGIYDLERKTIPRIGAHNLEAAREAVAGADGVDVTGGMRHRLDTVWALARNGIESQILSGMICGRLQAALRGEEVPGTLVQAG